MLKYLDRKSKIIKGKKEELKNKMSWSICPVPSAGPVPNNAQFYLFFKDILDIDD